MVLMSRRGLQIVVLVGLLLLAGCTTYVRSDPTTKPDTTSELPPGVTEDGITNVSKLLSAHFTALNRTGYTDMLTARYTEPEHSDGPTITLTERSTLTATEGMYPFRHQYESTKKFPNGTVESGEGELWSNESMHVSLNPSHPRVNSTVYCRWTDPYESVKVTHLRYPFHGVLNASDYNVSSVNTSGERTRTTLEAESNNFTATAVIDSTGRIRHLEMNATQTLQNGRTATRALRYDLKEARITAVERPAWVNTAIDRVPHPEEDTCSHLR